ncbi:MAG: signal recognition particle protein Srp19 [Thermococcus sp.]|nr:signal recognition particle protein Srp19 [Thermococcus sp.]
MGKFVIWANEIDARIPRKYGREVPKNLAVEKPDIDEIIDATKNLGITVVEVNKEALNPRLAGLDEELRVKGRIIVESKHGKSKTLKLIAQKVREFRKAHRKK